MNLLEQIGGAVREEQKDDARFERVARGETDRELETAAADDPTMAARLEGSRPLDASAAERIAARVTKKKVVVPIGRRRLVTVAGPLALAAAIIFYFTTASGPSLPELPAYTVTATGEQAMRGPAETAQRLRLGNAKDARFEILLRPATAPASKVVAYPFALMPGSEPSPLDAKVEISPDGAVRLTGSSRVLAGASEIRVVIGSPEAIGKFDDALARAQSGRSDERVRVLSVGIDRN